MLPRRLRVLPRLPPREVARAHAAVSVVLRTGIRGAEALALERAERPGDPWSGQVGLPGGRSGGTDRNLLETALRELEEEVGLTPADFDGRLGYFGNEDARPASLRVAIFVGVWDTHQREPAVRSPSEVADLFWLPLSELAGTERVARPTALGPAVVEATRFEGHVIWGFTRRVLRRFSTWLSEVGTPSQTAR